MPLRFTCPNCSKDIIIQYLSQGQVAKCRHCGAEVIVPENAEIITPEQAAEYADKLREEGALPPPPISSEYPSQLSPAQSRKVGFLRVVAWVILIGGVFMGLMMTIVGIAIMYEGEIGTEVVGMGLAVIIQAVAIFALLLVVAMIAESLVDIQEKMTELVKLNREKKQS